ncbi:MAG: NPCBM/NEW2 domain-containing protein, partial [Planctomycetota bacterium]|nr:NPCBM/NEW2 domain-containing protein [Planctomycetota bacterium]
MIRLSLLLLCSVCVHTVWAVEPHEAELKKVDDWVRASFAGEKIVPSHDGYLEVTLEHGSLLKNMATTKVYHKQLGSLPMKIHRKTYQHGLYLPSPGTIRVVLPSAARRFDASFGIDSNRVTSFYSNAGRGSVIGMVSIGERQVYVTRKMQEGMPGEKVSVSLEGAKSFTLTTKGHAEGIIEQVDFNQSDWA